MRRNVDPVEQETQREDAPKLANQSDRLEIFLMQSNKDKP